jgi:hypothetical protein
MSAARSGDNCTQETRNRLSLSLRGLKRTDETRRNMSKAKTGLRHTEQTKEKLSLMYRGERSLTSKLTEEEVKEIRRLHLENGVRNMDLAIVYSVDRSTISDIVRGKTWKHLLDKEKP